ncbi:hypothetical protein PoB_004080300 [Plakobranchus ocellatus]|uniref:Uncharacterized protein n=1 Tax=Plakobranchus ocellatus TaxID=259542 RepID=A0AAV4B5E0_9GAST|nr:hypothetical protein PoB_004080300 [Plakobranchus ocellatus]
MRDLTRGKAVRAGISLVDQWTIVQNAVTTFTPAITTDSIMDAIGDHHIGHATMDQDALDFPVARIHAETPFITSVLEALVVEDPIADLIIENHGKISDRPLKEWLNDSNNDNDRKEQPRYANAVTRGDIRADTAIASVQNKGEPKTELNCLDYNAFRK